MRAHTALLLAALGHLACADLTAPTRDAEAARTPPGPGVVGSSVASAGRVPAPTAEPATPRPAASEPLPATGRPLEPAPPPVGTP